MNIGNEMKSKTTENNILRYQTLAEFSSFLPSNRNETKNFDPLNYSTSSPNTWGKNISNKLFA